MTIQSEHMATLVMHHETDMLINITEHIMYNNLYIYMKMLCGATVQI